MSKKRLARCACLLVAYLCVTSYFIWQFFPSTEPSRRQRIEGIPVKYKTNGRISKSTFKIDDVVFTCAASPLGHSHTCPTQFNPEIVAVVTYFRMPTLLTALFADEDVPVLMRLEQKGQALLVYGTPDVIDGYERSSFFMALYLSFPFFLLSRLSFFRKDS